MSFTVVIVCPLEGEESEADLETVDIDIPAPRPCGRDFLSFLCILIKAKD